MKQKKDVIFITAIAAIAVILGVGTLSDRGQKISFEENRALADPPALSVSGILDGSFFSELSAFCSDRIPLREQMIRTKAVCELAMGKRENGGVAFTSGRLVDRCVYGDLEVLEDNLHRLREFSERRSAVTVIVPRSADAYIKSEEASAVRALVGDSLCEKLLYTDEAYYKTDHHLDAEGAFAAYEYVMESLGYTPLSRSDFVLTSVSEDFYGTVYSRAGLLPVYRDSVSAWRYVGDGELTVRCFDAGCSAESLYCEAALAKKDKYRYFLGGNHGCITVSREGEERPKLYLIKDSFANAVIPLLARHFDLTVYDPRYLSAPPPCPEGATTVVLCGLDTLATTGSFTLPLALIN